MKRINSLVIAFGCLIPFAVSAQWVQAPNGDLSTSKDVTIDGNTYLDGEVRINATWAPLSMKTGIQSIIDLTLIQNASVGYMGGDHYNFVSGIWSGINGSGPRPALRVGKVAGAEWTLIGYMSTAIGEDVGAQGNYTFSIGYGSRANGDYSVAMGGSTANGEYATALGKSSTGADYAFAAGDAHAGGRYSVALNTAGTNSGDYSTAINSAYSDGDYSFAAGNSYTHGKYSTALGQAETTGTYSLCRRLFFRCLQNKRHRIGHLPVGQRRKLSHSRQRTGHR